MKNLEITDEQMIELIEGGTNEKLMKVIEESAELKKRYSELKQLLETMDDASVLDVPESVSLHVQSAIQQELAGQRNKVSWLQVAAAVTILIVGFGIGRFSGSQPSSELAELKNEIQSLKEVTLTSALQQYSASERIMAVNQIEQSAEQINPELISTLINTLNGDESPSVRYAALQALNKYIDNVDVRAELVKSLESQRDPLIQITLITILVEAEERSAIAPLKDIMESEEITPEVKQQAEVAIQVLT